MENFDNVICVGTLFNMKVCLILMENLIQFRIGRYQGNEKLLCRSSWNLTLTSLSSGIHFPCKKSYKHTFHVLPFSFSLQTKHRDFVPHSTSLHFFLHLFLTPAHWFWFILHRPSIVVMKIQLKNFSFLWYALSRVKRVTYELPSVLCMQVCKSSLLPLTFSFALRMYAYRTQTQTVCIIFRPLCYIAIYSLFFLKKLIAFNLTLNQFQNKDGSKSL